MVAVEHQRDVGPDRLTHGGAGLDVHLWVRREGNRRHPGVQLDGLVAALDQLFGELAVLVRRRQATRQVIAAHRRAVRRDLVAITADQLVYRLPERAAGKVPQRAIHHRQRAVSQLCGRTALPVGKVLPQPFPVAMILTDQDFLDEFFNDMRANDLRRGEGMTFLTVFGADGQHGLFHLMRRTRMRVTGTVRVATGRRAENTDLDVGDDHNSSLMQVWQRLRRLQCHTCMRYLSTCMIICITC
ncbi:hypothetical protein D3C78_1212790 [compost metagenome]